MFRNGQEVTKKKQNKEKKLYFSLCFSEGLTRQPLMSYCSMKHQLKLSYHLEPVRLKILFADLL